MKIIGNQYTQYAMLNKCSMAKLKYEKYNLEILDLYKTALRDKNFNKLKIFVIILSVLISRVRLQ